MEQSVADSSPRTGWLSSIERTHLRRAGAVAAGVGTALVVLNQGDVLLAWLAGGALLPSALGWKVPLTYAVPFLVSLGSSVAERRR
ncbi:MAG TPA: hypothetical protein VI356_23005 [Myxococcales bacterium]